LNSYTCEHDELREVKLLLIYP